MEKQNRIATDYSSEYSALVHVVGPLRQQGFYTSSLVRRDSNEECCMSEFRVKEVQGYRQNITYQEPL